MAPSALTATVLPGWEEPLAVFDAVVIDHPYEPLFWLDAGPDAAQGWSIIGVGRVEGAANAVRDVTLPSVGSPSAIADDATRPPFLGGWVGWLDYESGAAAQGAPSETSADEPVWIRVTRAVAFDHERQTTWALAPAGETAPGAGRRLSSWLHTGRGADDVTAPGAAERHALPDRVSSDAALQDASSAQESPVARAAHGAGEYARLIERCRDAIRAGDAYQLCLTTRFAVQGTHDPVRVYRRLRAATPTHHGAFIRAGSRTLLSASPEQFLQVRAGEVTTRPIKGTRPRGETPGEDSALAVELRESAKERAENVMIVDLMRNDLSRVCVPGTVRADTLLQVESYPAVHQLVSTVRGQLRDETTAGELWDVAFPAGSMTGAPKLSAMTILHALEGHPRGIYSGAFGYVGLGGEMDLGMVIRSIVIDEGEARVGAGGGITWGSRADEEVAEVATKAEAPLAALGAILPADWAAASGR